MTTAWILIAVLVSGVTGGAVPSMLAVEFADRTACDRARATLHEQKPKYMTLTSFCVPKGATT